MDSVLGRFFVAVITFFVTLIFEILLAMSLFVYIRLNLPSVFEFLQNLSFSLLNIIRDAMRSFMPGVAEDANIALVGDLSANAMTLLLLGLVASGVIRIIVWSIRRTTNRVVGN